MTNTWKRKSLSILSVPLLAVPSALGVYGFLAPTSGALAAGLAASGFELLYVGVNVLVLSPRLHAYARNVALAAVATAVMMNTLAHYASGDSAVYYQPFDLMRATLALIASAPLAALAYAVSVLLHKLNEEESALSPRQYDSPVARATPVQAQQVTVNVSTGDSDATVSVSKSERVRQLASAHGVSETTIWRRLKNGQMEPIEG